MTKAEMEKLLIEEYGFTRKELRDDKGNVFNNSVLKKMIEKAEKEEERVEEPEAEEVEVEESKGEPEDDFFGVDETIFKAHHNLKDDDLVLCMSGVSGDLKVVSEMSNFVATSKKFGQTMKIPYKDLTYLRNVAGKAFEDGTIIILNKDVQDEFGLTESYRNVLTPKNIRKVIELEPERLQEFIRKMPKGMKTSLYSEAKSMYDAGKIDSRGTIKVFEDEFGVSFDDNAPLSDRIQQNK